MENNQTNSAYGNEQLRRRSLVSEIRRRDSREAAKLLMGELPNVAGQVLLELNPGRTTTILQRFSEDFVARVLASVPAEYARQWARNQAYAHGSIGSMMDPATASSIFLTTATDIASMGCFLGLATIPVA